jgi:hypothetical protein
MAPQTYYNVQRGKEEEEAQLAVKRRRFETQRQMLRTQHHMQAQRQLVAQQQSDLMRQQLLHAQQQQQHTLISHALSANSLQSTGAVTYSQEQTNSLSSTTAYQSPTIHDALLPLSQFGFQSDDSAQNESSYSNGPSDGLTNFKTMYTGETPYTIPIFNDEEDLIRSPPIPLSEEILTSLTGCAIAPDIILPASSNEEYDYGELDGEKHNTSSPRGSHPDYYHPPLLRASNGKLVSSRDGVSKYFDYRSNTVDIAPKKVKVPGSSAHSSSPELLETPVRARSRDFKVVEPYQDRIQSSDVIGLMNSAPGFEYMEEIWDQPGRQPSPQLEATQPGNFKHSPTPPHLRPPQVFRRRTFEEMEVNSQSRMAHHGAQPHNGIKDKQYWKHIIITEQTGISETRLLANALQLEKKAIRDDQCLANAFRRL